MVNVKKILKKSKFIYGSRFSDLVSPDLEQLLTKTKKNYVRHPSFDPVPSGCETPIN